MGLEGSEYRYTSQPSSFCMICEMSFLSTIMPSSFPLQLWVILMNLFIRNLI